MRWGEISRELSGGSCGGFAEGTAVFVGRPREGCCGDEVGAWLAERMPGVADAAAVRAMR